MEVTPPVSRYEQLARDLRQQILAGDYPPGARLPSGTALAKQHNLSQHAGQNAIEMLEREGLVETRQGSGTYVRRLRAFRVTLVVARPAADRERDGAALRRAFEAGVEAEPAADRPGVRVERRSVMIVVRVRAVSGGRATRMAEDLAAASAGEHWTWEGLDLDGALTGAELDEARPE